MSDEMEGRILARQLADVRELNLDELEGIDGGGTYSPTSCDAGPTQGCYCTDSWNGPQHVPCDLDWQTTD
jgi:hypothetical protein